MSKRPSDVSAARPDSGVPDVTVTVMSYNNARFLRRTVDSVLAQKGVALELIVHDDCSSDDSVAILESCADTDPRFSFSLNERNLGAFRNYNRCLDSGRARYAVVLGSDDVLYPGHLASLVAAMDEHSHCDLGYVQCNWLDEDDRLLGLADHAGHARQSYFGGRNELADLLRFDNYITPSAAILRRSALGGLRLPDGSIHRPDMPAGDWELWCRLALINPDFVFLRQATVGYRVHGGQISQKFYASEAPLRDHARILELVFAAVRATDGAARLRPWLPSIWAYFEQRMAAYSTDTQGNYRGQSQRLRSAMLGLLLAPPAPASTPREGPLVSVVVPTKDRPELLCDALRSLVRQRYEHWEAIVVNDGGADVSEQVLALDPSGRVRYLAHERNRGLPAARNTALAAARGEIVCYLDDDDVFLPDHLATVVDAFADRNAGFVYTDAEYVVERLENGLRHELGRDRRYADLEYSRPRLHCMNFIPVNTWAHRRELLDKTGLFDETLTAFEDWDLLLRMAAVTEPLHLRAVTVEVRLRTSTTENMTARERKNFPALYRKLYQRHGDLGIPEVAELQARLLVSMEGMSPTEGGAASATTATIADDEYLRWRALRQCRISDVPQIDRIIAAFGPRPPVIHLILRVESAQFPLLAQTLESLNGQLYANWRADVISTAPTPGAALDQLPQLSWHTTATAEEAKIAIDMLVTAHAHPWIAELPPGAALDPLCLFRVAHVALTNASPAAIYCDDDTFDTDGIRNSPRLKPHFDIDWVRCTDLLGPLFVSADAWRAAGGASASPVRPWYDLALRLSERFAPDQILHISEPLLSLPVSLTQDEHARECRAAVARHIARCASSGAVEAVSDEVWRPRWRFSGMPHVTIAIPSLDRPEMLGPCIDAILRHTIYPSYDVLVVDGGSSETDTIALHADLGRRTEASVRVVVHDAAWSFAAYANSAAGKVEGEFLLLLGDDVRVVTPDWLTRMVALAQRDDVAAVGPRIVSPPDGAIAQAGFVLGLDGLAGTPHCRQAGPDDSGYLKVLQVDRSVAALPGDCVLIRCADFLDAGGMDEGDLAAEHADVDFSLRLAAHTGRGCVVTAGVTVVKTGGSCLDRMFSWPTDAAEHQAARLRAQETVLRRWFDAFTSDRHWSKHLDRSDAEPRLELRWAPEWHALPLEAPRILAFPVLSAQGEIRITRPLMALRTAGKALSAIYQPESASAQMPSVQDLARHRPHVIVAHQLIGQADLMAIRQWREFLREVFLVYAVDDLLTEMPSASSLRANVPADARTYLARALQYCDRLVVSTPFLAERYGHLAKDVRIVPNRLEREVWTRLQSRRRTSARPRIGWAGGTAHMGDLQLIADVVAATADEADWVFMGMCPDNLRPHVKEFHPFGSYADYPARLASLDLDLAVAPLEEIAFNRGKSNLRLLEYGALGIPVVCTEIDPYRDSPACKVSNRPGDWIEALRARIHDLDGAEREGEAMRRWVQDYYILEDHLDEWLRAHLPD